MSAKKDPEPHSLQSYARALRRRYPGISVEIRWNNHETMRKCAGKPGYKGWMICCAGSATLLARYGLATELELESSRHRCAARPKARGNPKNPRQDVGNAFSLTGGASADRYPRAADCLGGTPQRARRVSLVLEA